MLQIVYAPQLYIDVDTAHITHFSGLGIRISLLSTDPYTLLKYP